MACVLLTHAVMNDPAMLSPTARRQVLRFAASFLWADLAVADADRRFLTDLADELDVGIDEADFEALLKQPPRPEEVDPGAVTPDAADVIRHAALRAIAADGHVGSDEMDLFELLDDLLPRGAPQS